MPHFKDKCLSFKNLVRARQTDESNFIGRSPTNVERPKTFSATKQNLVIQYNHIKYLTIHHSIKKSTLAKNFWQ